ncbi:hypothetical protein Nepgr_012999 [Nepenthes gracilis]|uniref:Uncharacterized protein n=1 Tax=Nepenthes gracilis TaxID=150966 RepID=A0AAD3XNK9_NEPGR|nr:hypothetical protein Nepgr_012999 [Nepenthes gracilis]
MLWVSLKASVIYEGEELLCHMATLCHSGDCYVLDSLLRCPARRQPAPGFSISSPFILLLLSVRNRLTSGDGRANIWVVDDEHLHEYYLTIVDRDHRYSIISWSHVLQNRQLTEGQVLRFGWMDQKLHFVVIDKENDDEAEENKADGKDNEDERDQGEKDTAKEVAEPAKKKAKQDTGEASTSQPHTGVIVDP